MAKTVLDVRFDLRTLGDKVCSKIFRNPSHVQVTTTWETTFFGKFNRAAAPRHLRFLHHRLFLDWDIWRWRTFSWGGKVCMVSSVYKGPWAGWSWHNLCDIHLSLAAHTLERGYHGCSPRRLYFYHLRVSLFEPSSAAWCCSRKVLLVSPSSCVGFLLTVPLRKIKFIHCCCFYYYFPYFHVHVLVDITSPISFDNCVQDAPRDVWFPS